MTTLVSHAPMSLSHATSEVKSPSDESLRLLPSGWPLDVPLARVRTCGTLVVEVLIDLIPDSHGHLQPVYGAPLAHILEIKGMTTAFLLLALLTSQPDCFASKDFLIQTLPYMRHHPTTDEEIDQAEDGALKRLDNVVSHLRTLLYPPKLLDLPGKQKLRKYLVRHVRATSESGPGYRLAAFPLVWLDIEAMETYMKEARSREEHGEDGLEGWRAVYQTGMRGPFLGHEPYSEWANWRRLRVADLLWQSVDAQRKRAELWGNETHGIEAARSLLFDFWQGHQTNEDAFCALIELLGKQKHFQQAEECYKQLCAALEREGHLLQKRTQECMDLLRTMPVANSQVVERTVDHRGERPGQDAPTTQMHQATVQRIVYETSHLIGREIWLAGVQQMVQQFPAKKLIVLQGPIGVGKSSEMIRLTSAFQQTYRVIWLPFPAAEATGGPEAALDVLLGTLLSDCGIAPFPSEAPRSQRIAAFLTYLEKQNRPTVILLDNAECALEEHGALAACWEAFLAQFLRRRHQTTFFLATKEWHGWPGRDSTFIAETFVPPLTDAESVRLLQRLGLKVVPVELLQAVGRRLTGNPLLLEWTAKLVTDPLLDWVEFDETEAISENSTTQEDIVERVQRFLNDPSIYGEHLANKLAPLLQRILEKHLSDEARLVLNRLSVTTVPLGNPALQMLCPRLDLLRELRDASLLARYTNRVQLLPVVAWTVQQQLAPEQRREVEDEVIEAYTCWLDEGNLEMQEAGQVVTELAVLLLKHCRLLQAAQLLCCYGDFCLKIGQGPRLAQLAEQIMSQDSWYDKQESEYGGTLVHYFLSPFLGKNFDRQQRVKDYSAIYKASIEGEIHLRPTVELFLVHYLMVDKMNEACFEEAQVLLEECNHRLNPFISSNINVNTGLLEKHGMLLSYWCEYTAERGEMQTSRALREQAITIYEQLVHIHEKHEETCLLTINRLKGRLSYAIHYQGYHLYRIGQYEKALQALEQSATLQEQGYTSLGNLPACYSDISQTLAAIGRFREALLFDEKAYTEAKRHADQGDIFSQAEIWIYYVSRGCLYLRLGKVHEAEPLLREALSHITEARRMYRMFAKEALEEIAQWRRTAVSPQYQLDWRWVKRYRELVSYDTYWWLTAAGPFSEEEQKEWDQLFRRKMDEATKTRLGSLLRQSQQREIEVALAERREPCFHHPALEIEDVRARLVGLTQLDEDIAQSEPNATVRKLYHGTIEEEVDTLRQIEATYERNSAGFKKYMESVISAPTAEEMRYALSRVRLVLLQGISQSETRIESERLRDVFEEQCGLTFDLSWTEQDRQILNELFPSSTRETVYEAHMVSPQTAKRFFETALQESGFEGWQVMVDPNALSARVEQGLRCLFLTNHAISVQQVRHLLLHELAGHVNRCVTGERSLLGLLGIHTKNSLETEEGLAVYHDRLEAQLQGETLEAMGSAMGTLATGLACGITVHPQTFRQLCILLEALNVVLRRLLWPDQGPQEVREYARNAAIRRCLRTYRGVPDLTQVGVCFTQDALYLRGLWTIERALAENEDALNRLAVGVVAVEQLPDLLELGIVSAPQPLRTLADDPQLEAYILSLQE